MAIDKTKKPEDGNAPAADTGNASNPSGATPAPAGPNQLLDKGADKYIREAGNIEDMPDEQDWQDADEVIKKEKEH